MRALQHEPVLRFICGVWAKHVQRCRYNIQLSNRTGRLWWVTDHNKDGVWMRCHWRTFNYLSFFLFLYYAYSIILNDRLSNLFIFLCCTFHCVNSKMLNEFSILTGLIKYILGQTYIFFLLCCRLNVSINELYPNKTNKNKDYNFYITFFSLWHFIPCWQQNVIDIFLSINTRRIK